VIPCAYYNSPVIQRTDTHYTRVEERTLFTVSCIARWQKYFPVPEIVNTLGPDRCCYSDWLQYCFFTHHQGKKSAWTAYLMLIDAFLELSVGPASICNCRISGIIQRFVVCMYERTSAAESVDACRKHLFAQKGRSMESIPPTEICPWQHAKRACF